MLSFFLWSIVEHNTMRKAELYETVFDHWKGFENHESRKDRSMYNLEAFSDASWGDDKSSRKSTSSGVLFLNGMLVAVCVAPKPLLHCRPVKVNCMQPIQQ